MKNNKKEEYFANKYREFVVNNMSQIAKRWLSLKNR